MSWGLPYKGSKNRYVEKIFSVFPKAKHFYDLFGGGGAMTHFAITQKKFDFIHYNDINRKITQFFCDAVDGRYANEDRWISREAFKHVSPYDMYVAQTFSFGNDGRTYFGSPESEEIAWGGGKQCCLMTILPCLRPWRNA